MKTIWGFVVLLAANSIAATPLIKLECVTNKKVKIEVVTASFYYSDCPTSLVVSLEVEDDLPPGSEMIVSYVGMDSLSNLWFWGEATRVEINEGYTIYSEPMVGWINATVILRDMGTALDGIEKYARKVIDDNEKQLESLERKQQEWEKEDTNLGITYKAYLKIDIGMSWFDVWRIIGEVGTETKTSGSLTYYEYSDSNKIIRVTMDGGKVSEKSHSGLR